MDGRKGKVDKLLCSKDREVWLVEIIVIKSGQKLKLQRPINKLYPFECSTDKGKLKLTFVKDEGTKMIKVTGGVYWTRRPSLINEVWTLHLLLKNTWHSL